MVYHHRMSYRLTHALLAALLVAGCAGTSVSPQRTTYSTSIPRPAKVLVYDLEISTKQIRENQAAAQRAIKRAAGKPASLIRSGGSIPVAGMLKARLGIDTIFMGFGLDDDRVHSPNEKFELDCFDLGARCPRRLRRSPPAQQRASRTRRRRSGAMQAHAQNFARASLQDQSSGPQPVAAPVAAPPH